jgi:hypothetical protein
MTRASQENPLKRFQSLIPINAPRRAELCPPASTGHTTSHLVHALSLNQERDQLPPLSAEVVFFQIIKIKKQVIYFPVPHWAALCIFMLVFLQRFICQ